MPKASKSREKSPDPVPAVRGRPFQRGGPQGPGRGPAKGAPNAGRPPDRIKELAEQGLEIAVWGAIEIVHGEPTEKIQFEGKDGEVIEAKRSASADTRIRAGEFLGKVSHRIGARLEIEHKQEKPFVVVVRPE